MHVDTIQFLENSFFKKKYYLKNKIWKNNNNVFTIVKQTKQVGF